MHNRKKYQILIPAVLWILGGIQIIRYMMLGDMTALLTVTILELWFGLAAYASYRGNCPFFLLLAGFGAGICGFFTNHAETTWFNVIYLYQAVAAMLGGIIGTFQMIRKKEKPNRKWITPTAAVLTMFLVFLAVWGVSFWRVPGKQEAEREIWGVPEKFDSVPAQAQGTVEEFAYQTKAYATDMRDVSKTAMVYLPAGYDNNRFLTAF